MSRQLNGTTAHLIALGCERAIALHHYLHSHKVRTHVATCIVRQSQMMRRSGCAYGLSAVVHAHGQHVVLAWVQPLRQFILKTAVSIGSHSQFVPVDVHGRVHMHTVKLHEDAFALLLGLVVEVLAVPSHAARQCHPRLLMGVPVGTFPRWPNREAPTVVASCCHRTGVVPFRSSYFLVARPTRIASRRRIGYVVPPGA